MFSVYGKSFHLVQKVSFKRKHVSVKKFSKFEICLHCKKNPSCRGCLSRSSWIFVLKYLDFYPFTFSRCNRNISTDISGFFCILRGCPYSGLVWSDFFYSVGLTIGQGLTMQGCLSNVKYGKCIYCEKFEKCIIIQ